MTYSVEMTAQAEKDLRGIYSYIAYVLQSPQNAGALLARLEKSVAALGQLPERYRRYEREPWRSRGWRIMPVGHYCVFYLPDDSRRAVTITRILYAGRDMGCALADDGEC